MVVFLHTHKADLTRKEFGLDTMPTHHNNYEYSTEKVSTLFNIISIINY